MAAPGSRLQHPLSDSAGPWTSSSSPTTSVMQAICPQKLYIIIILRRLASPLPPAMSLSPVSFPIPRPIHHHDPVTETNGATRPNPRRGRLSPGDDDDAPPSGMRRGTRLGPGLGIWPMAVVECPSLEISSWPPSPNGAPITTRSHPPCRPIHLLPFAPESRPRNLQQGRHMVCRRRHLQTSHRNRTLCRLPSRRRRREGTDRPKNSPSLTTICPAPT